MKRVLLDGEYVDSSTINPKEHKYIGLFRPPEPTDSIFCPCGSYLGNMPPVIYQHWQMGHMDSPQYITIK
jgi:hypothetical protein